MMVKPVRAVNSAVETTSAGRRLACSWPACGLKSTQIRWPRAGTVGVGTSQHLVADGRAGVEEVVSILGRDPRQQLGEGVFRLPLRHHLSPIRRRKRHL